MTPVTDHCRIGSLEIEQCSTIVCAYDHCRIGSLEMLFVSMGRAFCDHCRIGSLEKDVSNASSNNF